ncbi:peptide chain release factor N(5)-glutamine methyltransferase [Butyrivibrio sp. X503]|uniref:peptide chain release factor N(5)-glutamine methyltransferase n=1 Tax=Butyrivibrio sp. X503 TaxID=2364878 RepID=UPI000EA916D3|nr:peptide chain release factor N(5)-glutamine methyltransferase [Butyrivibrio sp. X503]RKM55633.1 peptide chain release factor N(5)-glutamine methyltransferase [Butyrivibrio sp. X503]
MIYKDILEKGIETLERAGITEAKLDARLLLEYVCETDHSTLYAHPDREVSEVEEQKYNELLSRREKREPVAYILGKWEFMGLSFNVSKDVLIPEQDTEVLVEEALRYCEDKMRILDLCTGSGCIALSILNYTNDTKAVCTDISEAALKVAKENADILGFNDRIEFIETDLFPEKEIGKFDVIVSNPPYIRTEVIKTLAPEVKDYEPMLALDGSDDGLIFYKRIIENAGDYLFSSGYLIMEIGYDQAEAVKALLTENGKYHDIEVIADYAGNDRVVRACYY